MEAPFPATGKRTVLMRSSAFDESPAFSVSMASNVLCKRHQPRAKITKRDKTTENGSFLKDV